MNCYACLFASSVVLHYKQRLYETRSDVKGLSYQRTDVILQYQVTVRPVVWKLVSALGLISWSKPKFDCTLPLLHQQLSFYIVLVYVFGTGLVYRTNTCLPHVYQTNTAL